MSYSTSILGSWRSPIDLGGLTLYEWAFLHGTLPCLICGGSSWRCRLGPVGTWHHWTPMKPDSLGHVQVEKLHTWVWMVLSGVESIRVYPIPQDHLNQKRTRITWLMVITWSWFQVSKKNRCQHGPVTIVFCKKYGAQDLHLAQLNGTNKKLTTLPNC